MSERGRGRVPVAVVVAGVATVAVAAVAFFAADRWDEQTATAAAAGVGAAVVAVTWIYTSHTEQLVALTRAGAERAARASRRAMVVELRGLADTVEPWLAEGGTEAPFPKLELVTLRWFLESAEPTVEEIDAVLDVARQVSATNEKSDMAKPAFAKRAGPLVTKARAAAEVVDAGGPGRTGVGG